MEHPDSGIFPGKPVAERRTAVRGTVVHQNNLQVPVCLSPDGTDTFLQVGFDVIYRHYDRYAVGLLLFRNRAECIMFYFLHGFFLPV